MLVLGLSLLTFIVVGILPPSSAFVVESHPNSNSDRNDRIRNNRIGVTSRDRNRPPSNSPSPVILVPGDGGSQVEAMLDKPDVVHYFCDKKTNDYFDLWLNLELLVPYVLDCWVDNMKLIYDNVTRTTRNSPGVDIRIPGFGNTTTVEWLDPSMVSPSAYFSSIVQNLTGLGFERGVNLRAAPYDFRKGPNELGDFFIKLQQLIEETYTMNSNRPAVLICHSMGCPLSLILFNKMTQAWKDKYIKAYITLGAPWGGAAKAAKAFASGDNLGVVVINALTVRAEQRTCPSTAFLMPSDKFWGPNDILVSTAERNYTVNDFEDFFRDINLPEGFEMWKDNNKYIYDLTPPGVEAHCLHGIGMDTIDTTVYAKDRFPDSNPTLIFGDGDGTVNVRSLHGCLRWQGQQEQKVFHREYNNTDHMQILSHPDMIAYVRNIIVGG